MRPKKSGRSSLVDMAGEISQVDFMSRVIHDSPATDGVKTSFCSHWILLTMEHLPILKADAIVGV